MSLDPLSFDLRVVDTQAAISDLRKYLDITETQMDKVYRIEKDAHEAEAASCGDEEGCDLHWQIGNFLEQRYQQELIPAMRYSFVVLVHIIFENHLRQLCSQIKKDRNIQLTLSEIAGSPIERVRTYLTKLAALPVGDFPEWQHVRTVQKVRDCVVHAYGRVSELKNDGDKQVLRELTKQNIGVTIDESERLVLGKPFCEWCLSHVDKLFENLFVAAGWYKSAS